MKKKLKRIVLQVFARKGFQTFFERIHWVTLRLMNYGSANSPKYSGELYLLEHISKQKGLRVIFDVGANQGQYTRMVNKVMSKSTDLTIYSFEPSETSFQALSKGSKSIDRVKCFNMGLGDRQQTLKLYAADFGSVKASVYQSPDERESRHVEEIRIETLDDFCSEHEIERIDFLKIDTEGHEYSVLVGAKRMLDEGRIGVIQFEFGNQQVYSHHFLNDFFELLGGYDIYRLVQNGFVKIKRDPRFEIFQTTNYVAIPKGTQIS